ncbi:SUMF1/EgtB/PvdO family nonheme iron enzyme [Pelodictyon phaeoclathratiforme]|jgi:formylglycine-generating enzyme required for sulfatase activity|uniref:TIR domain-containing protein n=1 Tax=Pelodictyon phaeoclathratiforme (strain DSM 5477 / BU-1) TaxID=324925 RepID=B4SFR7_PELPB|nr:SUMF1/EgtB/PvdO family nonheme iron enzyme [Pelodictyon phaeoclathratiforme]ACF43322.1 protein of unknown function DUF323 [Pelodictyon phaeoclathratiforme BU-1]MBV5290361.1 SUMF1/EgtB/PvdO family nonheme iron enzyme [Pelodictyon phaeoclathratiforme]
MTDIFVSYAREDQERVRPIVKELEHRNWSVFWDLEIPPGETWESFIGKALEESSCVLAVWSHSSVNSDWVKEEADEAKQRGVLVPLFLDTVDAPKGFRRIQAADISGWKNNSSYPPFQSLLAAIESKISSASPHVVKPAPAPKSAERGTVVPTAVPKAPLFQTKNNSSERLFPKIQRQQAVWAVVALAVIIVGLFYFINHKTGNSVVPLEVSSPEKVVPGNNPPVATNVAAEKALLNVVAVEPVVPSVVSSTEKVVSGKNLPADTNVAVEMAQLNFVPIRGGTFFMGSPGSEDEAYDDEGPQHLVRLSAFYMSRYEVTVSEFRKFIEATEYLTDAEQVRSKRDWKCGVLGSRRPANEDNHPVIYVSWNDAISYCKWLSNKTGKTFRLPKEEEWEYACRAGSRTSTPFNTGYNLTTSQANYNGHFPYDHNKKGEFRKNTVPVNSFAPNNWGLYNMHGNVWEWCENWYGPYGSSDDTFQRVIRGGCWDQHAGRCRSANRGYYPPENSLNHVGFRVVCEP